MKTLASLLIMLVCGAALFAQETENITGESKVEKEGIFTTIINGLAESTRTINEINKENITAVKEESRTNFEAATASNQGIVKLNETKGFWNKIKVIFSNIRESANAQTEKEIARRSEIQNHNSYRNILREQRTNRQAVIAQ